MQNNRAVWLAILVLVIASAVMIFFVLPQINGGKNVTSEAAKTATDAAKPAADGSAANTVAETATKAMGTGTGAELLQKMNRLKADASAASESLRALYANGKVPTDAELADAKAKLQAALQAIADFKAPDGADATVGGLVTGLSASATKALTALKSMPEDAGKASAAAAQISALFSDKTGRNATAPAAPSAAAAAEPKLPSFDVLRVEKDGSTVIAGAASPKAKVEVLDGDKVIGSATAGSTGDFAIALDKPLEPGDHSLVLKATGADGKAATSAEVATVSVPNGNDGKLLAMVTKPGEASRILTKPDAGPQVAQSTTPSLQAAAAQPSGAEVPATSLPPLPDASKTLVNSAPAVPAGQQAATAGADTAQKPSEAAAIRIDAVEIEGDKIFVAGSTRPQATVQVFADDKLIETTKSSDSGHFEAENTMPLTTGNHIIRADLMDQTGSKAVVRASVPFNRPAGDQVSVVADTAKPAVGKGILAASPAMGQIEQLREEAAKALVLLRGLFADGKSPAKDQLAAARSATQIALKALADFKPTADSGADVVALAAKVGKSASVALKLLQAADDDPKAVGAAIASIEAAARDAMPEVAKPAPPATAATNETSSAAAPAQNAEETATAPAASTAADAPKSIEQAPLKESKDSVIIRKGDTLWQISRRVYGRGIRYTTIYLANQDLIDNPNKIAPGQVFGVPGKVTQSDEEAEKANRQLRKKH